MTISSKLFHIFLPFLGKWSTKPQSFVSYYYLIVVRKCCVPESKTSKHENRQNAFTLLPFSADLLPISIGMCFHEIGLMISYILVPHLYRSTNNWRRYCQNSIFWVSFAIEAHVIPMRNHVHLRNSLFQAPESPEYKNN